MSDDIFDWKWRMRRSRERLDEQAETLHYIERCWRLRSMIAKRKHPGLNARFWQAVDWHLEQSILNVYDTLEGHDNDY